MNGVHMKLEVSEETLKVTDKCKHNFRCLEGDCESVCKVDYCINGTICVLSEQRDFNCDYQTRFADDLFCMCPTRNELFRKYNQ
jgi:hypothetical protein